MTPPTDAPQSYKSLSEMPTDVLAHRIVGSLILAKGNLHEYKAIIQNALDALTKERAAAPPSSDSSPTDEQLDALFSAYRSLVVNAAPALSLGQLHERQRAAWDAVFKSSLKDTQQPDTAKVPEGWKLVPVNPPYAMVSKGMEALNLVPGDEIAARYIYRAMLAAAPSACSVNGNEAGGKR